MMPYARSPFVRSKMLAQATLCAALAAPVFAATPADQAVLDAREALRKKDAPALAAARTANAGHALAQWVEYWELSNRLPTAQAEEVEAFYTRWAGTYVEDRLRNDWLLELGRRRDWPALARDYPRFRMNDDREVTCYALLTQAQAKKDVREAARAAWLAQRDLDDGCNLMATTLYDSGVFKEADAWAKARLSVEFNRPRATRSAAALVNPTVSSNTGDLLNNPARWLEKKNTLMAAHAHELLALAVMRQASIDPETAAQQLQAQGLQNILPKPLASLAWAAVGKQAAQKLLPSAAASYQRALELSTQATPAQRSAAPWSDDTLGWMVRAALRTPSPKADTWAMVDTAIATMSDAEQRDPAWVYWRARATQALAPAGPEGEAARQTARKALEGLSGQMHFYGQLAADDLGRALPLPPAPAALTDAEREAVRKQPGLGRALQLFAIGLRHEAVREWNFALRGMPDRELLAAAQWACEREVWDRCINTSDRTRGEVDMAQRFPTPFRTEVLAKAQETGIDPAYIYGLIRQESRFVLDARSGVGASGLMQVMPSTARWTAKRIGMNYTPEAVTQIEGNLRLGTAYLKLVLDDFGGSQALAAAAYNAGPNRPRRWREGPPLEPAIWMENIPFPETRDYVKKVLSNAVYYSQLLGSKMTTLRPRMGPPIGPRDPSAPASAPDLP